MNILEIAKHKMDALNIGEAYKEIGPDGKPIGNGNKLTQEELQKRISDKDDEIQQLKSALYTAERKVADAQKQLDDEKTEFEVERRELVDLREYIFLRNQAEEQEEELSVSNEFPYDVKKSTVVFGGHPILTARSFSKTTPTRYTLQQPARDYRILKKASSSAPLS